MKYLILLLLVTPAFAHGPINTVPVDVTPIETPAYTAAMVVPDGYEMIMVEQPPQYTCEEIEVPPVFQMVPIAQPVTVQAPRVGQNNVDTITVITEGE